MFSIKVRRSFSKVAVLRRRGEVVGNIPRGISMIQLQDVVLLKFVAFIRLRCVSAEIGSVLCARCGAAKVECQRKR
jgi:hypothetical protein